MIYILNRTHTHARRQARLHTLFAKMSLAYAAKSSEQALRAMNNHLVLFKRVKFDIKTKAMLFDRMIVSIIFYSLEVLGIYHFEVLNIPHLKFCLNRLILGVRQQTSNVAVLGEVGRYLLTVIS